MALMASGLSPQMVWAFCEAVWQSLLCHWSRPSTPCSLGLEWEWINQKVWERERSSRLNALCVKVYGDGRDPPLVSFYLHPLSYINVAPRPELMVTISVFCKRNVSWIITLCQWRLKNDFPDISFHCCRYRGKYLCSKLILFHTLTLCSFIKAIFGCYGF